MLTINGIDDLKAQRGAVTSVTDARPTGSPRKLRWTGSTPCVPRSAAERLGAPDVVRAYKQLKEVTSSGPGDAGS